MFVDTVGVLVGVSVFVDVGGVMVGVVVFGVLDICLLYTSPSPRDS